MSIDWTPALAGTVGSLLAGLATGIGALPILGVGRAATRHRDLMMGFAAGVMLAASFFSLIVPALGKLEENGAGRWHAALTVAGSVMLGAGIIIALARCLPADRAAVSSDLMPSPRIGLFVLAITLHNLPEGLAVGVSFAAGAYAQGSATALGIGVQNIPEGFAVACALALRYRPTIAFAGGLLSGLVEPIAGTAGALLVAHFTLLLPWALCLAAGAMISVTMSQIVPDLGPEPYGRGQISLVLGLCLMMMLDIALS